MKVDYCTNDDVEFQSDISETLNKLNITLPARPRSAMAFFMEKQGSGKQIWDKLDGEDRMVYLAMENSDRERYQREVNLLTDRLMASKSAYQLVQNMVTSSTIAEFWMGGY